MVIASALVLLVIQVAASLHFLIFFSFFRPLIFFSEAHPDVIESDGVANLEGSCNELVTG